MSTNTATTPATRTLDCGATLVVETIPSARSAALAWLTPAGGAMDPEDRQGVGAMLEELLLRGSASRTSKAQADAFDLLGASRSADLQTVHMQYTSTFLGARFSEVAELVVDSLREPLFSDDAIDPARQLALQSLKGLDDEPQSKVMLAARERHAPSPFGRSGMGTEAGLNGVTREDVASHWGRCAVPGGSIIAVAGGVEADTVEAEFNRLLSGWAGSAAGVAYAGTGVRGYEHLESETEQTHIAVMHDAPAEGSADAVLERLAVAVLSGGMSGRLFTEVREKRGLCYAVSAGYATAREYGRVVSYSGTTPERAQETLDVLVGELRRINTPEGAVTAEELERATIGLKSKLVMSGESTSARAVAIAADFARLDRARSLAEIADEIDAVTVDQLNAYLARRELGELTVCTLGTKGLGFGG